MARTARRSKTGQQTVVNRPMRSTKSVYKTVQAQPTPGSKNIARRNGKDPLVDKPPGQHTPTDNPRVASKTARNQLVDKPPASAPPADNLGGEGSRTWGQWFDRSNTRHCWQADNRCEQLWKLRRWTIDSTSTSSFDTRAE